jgi:hypothetical protein
MCEDRHTAAHSDRSDQPVGPESEHDDTKVEGSRLSPGASSAMGERLPASKPSDGPLETAVKLAGFAGVVSAGMGFPAVYLHFTRLGIPTEYIDYGLVLSAGILPAVVLAILAILFRSILRQARAGDATSPLQALVLLPLMLPVFPVLFAGFAAFYLLVFWCLA